MSTTRIGATLRIDGSIQSQDSVLIEGRVRGRVESSESITVTAGAIVEADLLGREVFIADGAQFIGQVDLVGSGDRRG